MAKIRDAIRSLQAAQQEYHEKAPTLTSAEIAKETEKFKKLQSDVSAAIVTDEAKDCPNCKQRPHGMFHDGAPNPFEIGCISGLEAAKEGEMGCNNRHARGALPEDAIEDWNAEKYIPPREPGTAVLTHRDATGAIKSQRTVKVQRLGKSKLPK